jgi:hypothetical protein
MHRRELLIGLGLMPLVAPPLVRSVGAAGECDEDETPTEHLFVQTARGVSLEAGTLRLIGVAPSTLFFSDRPKRVAGHVPTNVLIDHWDTGGDDSFESDPPNATISILVGETPQEIVVVLENPGVSGDDITFDARVLEGNSTATGGACSLFIDDTVIVTGDPVVGSAFGPGSYRGTARRVARRTARRTTARRR